jgi:hypothetical protein
MTAMATETSNTTTTRTDLNNAPFFIGFDLCRLLSCEYGFGKKTVGTGTEFTQGILPKRSTYRIVFRFSMPFSELKKRAGEMPSIKFWTFPLPGCIEK